MPALPAIGLAVGAIGAGVSAYSTIQAGQAQNRIAQYNANLMAQQSQATALQAANKALGQRQQDAAILARQRAGYAASGVESDTGSPLLVEAKQAGYLEMQALQTQQAGAIESANEQQQSGLDLAQGSYAKTGSELSAGATLLQGAGTAGSTYAKNPQLYGGS
jgi:hypothetical protein